jgi:hypothetical protein
VLVQAQVQAQAQAQAQAQCGVLHRMVVPFDAAADAALMVATTSDPCWLCYHAPPLPLIVLLPPPTLLPSLPLPRCRVAALRRCQLDKRFGTWFSKSLFVVYVSFVMIVMFNLLIAVISTTYDRVIERKVAESAQGSVNQSVGPSVGRSVSQSVSRSVGRSVKHSVNQSISRSVHIG